MTPAGEELYRLVEGYAGLGEHRTGTPVDDATAGWFAEQLKQIGATVSMVPYDFTRYDARWTLKVNGLQTQSLPLFYEGIGRVRTTTPAVAALPVRAGGVLEGLPTHTFAARRDGRAALVVATIADGGRLVATNRQPRMGSGMPTICVAEDLAQSLATGSVEVDLDARLVAGQSANVIGTLGPVGARPPVLVTTPLTGWFRCASERGTGIAIALSLAQHLAETVPVVVLGTTGHELYYLGLRRHLDVMTDRPAAVVHLGASAAAQGADGNLSPSVRVVAASPSLDQAAAEDAMAPVISAYHGVAGNSGAHSGWRGEAALWAPHDLPLLSVAGGSPYFHSPEDLPHLSTTPSLIHTMATALTGLTSAVIQSR